jgi:pimeloyl-ACP methyl ester carboxylesterase
MVRNMTRRHAIGLTAAAPALFGAPVTAKTRGVDETGFVRIGGIDQWIGIQGNDARNPVILYLHGGPAEAQSPFLKQFIPWETDFIVVNWDQRGSGRTYGKNGPSTPGMSTPDLALDRLHLDARHGHVHRLPGDAAPGGRGRLGRRRRIHQRPAKPRSTPALLDFSIPFFVIQGREDHIAPFDVAQAYLAEVRAPKKAFIPIAGGHYACFTNPTEFVEALRRHARPLAK